MRPTLSLKKPRLLDKLIKDYPVFSKPMPLKKGIHLDILKENPDVGKKELKTALNIWCQTAVYQALLTKTGPRYDLAGNVAGRITQEAADIALGAMNEQSD